MCEHQALSVHSWFGLKHEKEACMLRQCIIDKPPQVILEGQVSNVGHVHIMFSHSHMWPNAFSARSVVGASL
jgi:hypothetical protein